LRKEDSKTHENGNEFRSGTKNLSAEPTETLVNPVALLQAKEVTCAVVYGNWDLPTHQG
jgi:hypothetical protein